MHDYSMYYALTCDLPDTAHTKGNTLVNRAYGRNVNGESQHRRELRSSTKHTC